MIKQICIIIVLVYYFIGLICGVMYIPFALRRSNTSPLLVKVITFLSFVCYWPIELANYIKNRRK